MLNQQLLPFPQRVNRDNPKRARNGAAAALPDGWAARVLFRQLSAVQQIVGEENTGGEGGEGAGQGGGGANASLVST